MGILKHIDAIAARPFGGNEIDIPCSGTVEEAAANLDAHVDSPLSFNVFGSDLIGRVSVDSVSILDRRPRWIRAAKAHFRGRFVETEGRVVLRGHVMLSRMAVLVLGAQFFAVTATAIFIIWTAIVDPQSDLASALTGSICVWICVAVVLGLHVRFVVKQGPKLIKRLSLLMRNC